MLWPTTEPTIHFRASGEDRTGCGTMGHATSLPEAVTCEGCLRAMEKNGELPVSALAALITDDDDECPDTERNADR
jgi:hypothetical protein